MNKSDILFTIFLSIGLCLTFFLAAWFTTVGDVGGDEYRTLNQVHELAIRYKDNKLLESINRAAKDKVITRNEFNSIMDFYYDRYLNKNVEKGKLLETLKSSNKIESIQQ